MARSRNIKPTFFSNEFLGDLDPLARLLFAGLWCQADREGRLQDRPKRLKIDVLPYDDCDVDQLLNDLAESKGDFIKRYTVDGNKYIQINNFLKHQNPHKKEATSIIPEYKSILVPYEHSVSTIQTLCNVDADAGQKEYLPDLDTVQSLYCTETSSNNEQCINNSNDTDSTVLKPSEIDSDTVDSNMQESCSNSASNDFCIVQEQVINDTSRADSLNPITDSLNPINTYSSTEVDLSEQNHCPYDEIVKLFNSICTSLSQVKQISSGRKKKLKARWGEIKNIDGFRNLFEKVQANSFLKGSNKSSWKATFDWLIENDSNYVKVLEGNYDKDNSSIPAPAYKSEKSNRSNFQERDYDESYFSSFFNNSKGDK